MREVVLLLMGDEIVYNNWVVSMFFSDKTEILELQLVTPGAPDLPQSSHAIGIKVKALTKSLLQAFIVIIIPPTKCRPHG